jgi:hypothetical protein
MGINAFTALGKTVRIIANTSPPAAVQVPSTTLGGNQYRVINMSSNTACFLSYAQTPEAALENCTIPTGNGTNSRLVLALLPQTDEVLSFVPNAYFTAVTIAGTADLYIVPGDGL